jgi:hypothetical protein
MPEIYGDGLFDSLMHCSPLDYIEYRGSNSFALPWWGGRVGGRNGFYFYCHAILRTTDWIYYKAFQNIGYFKSTTRYHFLELYINWEKNTTNSLRGLSSRAKYTDSDRHLSAKLVPTFEDRGCHVVSVTDPYARNLDFLARSRYFFFQVAPQLYSRGWVDPVPDPLLRKSGRAGIEPGSLDL